ncbi:MAG: helix-turn-helix transcriptional regulator [Ruminococcaceae bacterium]|nr:helix-turn-helix transcriptional regulator [Oscillospiraceae bacterium]
MSIGENIARFRKQKGWTQAALGEKLSVSSQAVSKWELGMTMPDVMLMPNIAKTFNVSIEELYYNDHNEKIVEENVNITDKNSDKRILVVSVEDKNSVVETRVPIKAIRALLINEKVKNEIDLEDEERHLIDNILNSSQGEIVNVGKGEKKTRITIEDYEA